MLFPGIPEPLCCLHQSLLMAVALHGVWVSLLARDRQWDRGSLAKEKMTWELDWLLIPTRWGWNQRPQSLAAARPETPACVWGCGGLLGRPGAMGVCKQVLGAQHRFFSSVTHRPQLGGLMWADRPGWAQLAELASQTGGPRVAFAVFAHRRQGSRDMCGPGLTDPSHPPKGKGKLGDAALVFCVVICQGKV